MSDISKITWVNHAGFLFEYKDVHLLTDPWLEGTAFYKGWDLVSKTQFTYSDFERVTHIWISHQHPDHFNPPNLKDIAPEIRARLVVLFQLTRDHLVANFCRTLNFKAVKELTPNRWTSLDLALDLLCRPVDDDSWLALRTPWGTILNLNDCVIANEPLARSIRRRVGPIRLLCTQFSYARWVGNPEDRELRVRAAREQLDRIRLQAKVFDPEYILPFASFVYFSHEENFYNNAEMNRVGDVARFIEDELGKKALVLYPGDVWTLGAPHDWRTAAERYEDDLKRKIGEGPVRFTRPLAPKLLQDCADAFFSRLREQTPRWLPTPAIKTSVLVVDHGTAFELTWDGLRLLSENGPSNVDIETTAENLFYSFRTPWGADCLAVNGRFRQSPAGNVEHFFRFFRMANLYGRAKHDTRWLVQQLLKRSMRYALRLARGRRDRDEQNA